MTIHGIRNGSTEITRGGAFETSRGTSGNFTDIVTGTRDAFTRTSSAVDGDGNTLVSRATEVTRNEDGTLSFTSTIQGPDGESYTREGTIEKTDAGTYTARGTLTGQDGATFEFTSTVGGTDGQRDVATEIAKDGEAIASVATSTVRGDDELTRTNTITGAGEHGKSHSSTIRVTGLDVHV